MPPRTTSDNFDERFWSRVEKTDYCWIWKACRNNHGYGQFRLNGRMIYVHRIVWELTYGEIPEGLLVLHHCDNPVCLNPTHLFLGTMKDNMEDMVRKKRDYRGKGSAKLTEQQVRNIHQECRQGEQPSIVAARYGVHVVNVYDILAGRKWKHLNLPVVMLSPGSRWKYQAT